MIKKLSTLVSTNVLSALLITVFVNSTVAGLAVYVMSIKSKPIVTPPTEVKAINTSNGFAKSAEFGNVLPSPTPTKSSSELTNSPPAIHNPTAATLAAQKAAEAATAEKLRCNGVDLKYAGIYVAYRASLPYPTPDYSTPEAEHAYHSAMDDLTSKLRTAYTQYSTAVSTQGCLINAVGPP